jgi:hypothetical protein
MRFSAAMPFTCMDMESLEFSDIDKFKNKSALGIWLDGEV